MSKFGQVQTSIREKKTELAQLLDGCVAIDNQDDIIACMDTINEMEKYEEILWKQRSQYRWVLEGDKNTHFLQM